MPLIKRHDSCSLSCEYSLTNTTYSMPPPPYKTERKQSNGTLPVSCNACKAWICAIKKKKCVEIVQLVLNVQICMDKLQQHLD